MFQKCSRRADGRAFPLARLVRSVISGLVIAVAGFALPAAGAEPPAIEQIVDAVSGDVLWRAGDTRAGPPELQPGQRILLRGRHFGPGPLGWAKPGLSPPAGGTQLEDFEETVIPSGPAPAGAELSKVMVGKVRATERNMPSYPARIDLKTVAESRVAALQGQVRDYFIEVYELTPDTWASDLYSWSDTEIEMSVPITAYDGPIRVVRIPVSSELVLDIRTGEPLRYRDPNTERVMVDGKKPAFTESWTIARTLGAEVLASNSVPVTVALTGDGRRRYAAPASSTDDEVAAARKSLLSAGDSPLGKDIPTGLSAAEQYRYGEKAYWAWDWNLGLPHFILGLDWNGIFGFEEEEYSRFLEFVRALRHRISGVERPEFDEEGYRFPVLAPDGSVRRLRHHKPIVDRTTDTGVRPFESFGAVPLLPEPGSDRLIAPQVVFDEQSFEGATPYPIPMAIDLPFSEPLDEGRTRPTGWAGYVYAEASQPVPGRTGTGEWIGFSCASCHADRVTFEVDAAGNKVTKLFNGIPNPNWKATWLALSGRGHNLRTDEPLPTEFVRHDFPKGIKEKVDDDFWVSVLRPLSSLGIGYVERKLKEAEDEESTSFVDKTLLAYSLPPGTSESTFVGRTGTLGAYANDYFFSPQAIPIISNHTPVRRALSHSELMNGFEGAYLHGEEPEGARGPMTSRALQSLTLFASTISQEDELLRRIGLYRWLRHKEMMGLLARDGAEPPNEGAFVSDGYSRELILSPPRFPPKEEPDSGLHSLRDAAFADPTGEAARNDPFGRRYPALAERIVEGAASFRQSCARCHAAGNLGTWTNEDMHPISASGGAEPVGRYFSPTLWNRRTQAIRTAILQNLYWVQRRGLLSDGHVRNGVVENMDGLELLVRPERCQAPVREDGSVDLGQASDLYKRLYTIRTGSDHSFRVPGAGRRMEVVTRFGSNPGAFEQVPVAMQDRTVLPEEADFMERHAYFASRDDGYLYWNYQKMRREYGMLEFGLDPEDSEDSKRIGGLPATPHPWCVEEGADQAEIDNLVMFLLTL